MYKWRTWPKIILKQKYKSSCYGLLCYGLLCVLLWLFLHHAVQWFSSMNWYPWSTHYKAVVPKLTWGVAPFLHSGLALVLIGTATLDHAALAKSPENCTRSCTIQDTSAHLHGSPEFHHLWSHEISHYSHKIKNDFSYYFLIAVIPYLATYHIFTLPFSPSGEILQAKYSIFSWIFRLNILNIQRTSNCILLPWTSMSIKHVKSFRLPLL